MDMHELNRQYNRYNPVNRYAIRPALELADAYNHPIRGGVAAALASGAAHYLLFETICQASDYLFGTDFSDPQTGLVFTNISPAVHFFVGINMLSNLTMGAYRYHKKK